MRCGMARPYLMLKLYHWCGVWGEKARKGAQTLWFHVSFLGKWTLTLFIYIGAKPDVKTTLAVLL